MPTIRQKLAVKKIMENQGNVSRSMKEVKYDPNTYKNPKNLTESKGFKELMEQYLPDQIAFKATKDALSATKIFSSHTEPDKVIADHPTRLKAADQVYKLKGRFVNEEEGTLMQINTIVVSYTNDK